MENKVLSQWCYQALMEKGFEWSEPDKAFMVVMEPEEGHELLLEEENENKLDALYIAQEGDLMQEIYSYIISFVPGKILYKTGDYYDAVMSWIIEHVVFLLPDLEVSNG